MTKRNSQRSPWVICVDNDGYAVSLERRKLYRTLPDREAESDGMLRVIDETGEDYLFPAACFRPVVLSPAVQRALSAPPGKRAKRQPA